MFDTIQQIIITTLGIDTLPVEKREDAMERLGAIVYQEVMLRVVATMSEEDKDAFEQLIEEDPDPETMFVFLAKRTPDLNTIVKEEAENVREQSATIMNEAEE